MLTYHTEESLQDIRNAIAAYENRNARKPTKNIEEETVVNLASGIVVVNGKVESVTVDLNLYDLTLSKNIVCKQFKKSEIIIFEKIIHLVIFLCMASKEQLLIGDGLRVDVYA
ncbi:hypothetical protein QI305_12290 [Staphylococcus saprophyticus]|nr:hypothetical protein [Staphylococcus saprophyticus]